MRSFRTKLFLVYSLTLITLMLTISFPMYFYFKNSIQNNIVTSVEQLTGSAASNLSSQLNMFNNMTFQLYNSYDNTRSTLADYLKIKSEAANTNVDLRARKSIGNFMLVSSNAYKSIARLNLYTANGELFAKEAESELVRIAGSRNAFANEADSAKGGVILIGSGNPSAFSLMRKLQWGLFELGYLEAVLKPNAIIDFERTKDIRGAGIFILHQDRVVYSSAGSNEEAAATLAALEGLASGQEAQLTVQSRDLFAVKRTTEFPEFSIVSVVPEKQLFAPLRVFRNVMILGVLLLIAFSVAFYYLLAKVLSRPITSLKQAMDGVKLEDSAHDLHIENKYKMNEVESLRRSFQKMNDRIQRSMEEKVQFRTLQLQSHFQTLQAQINPHFLFNMLSVITIMADKKDSASVADISRKLSRFMRYAVSTESPKASFRAEMDFTENYLNLMKSRYMHRLDYSIEVPPEMLAIDLPKLTVQPIVENCLQHGLGNEIKQLRIEIVGTMALDRWELEIRDNGKGFSEEALGLLHRRIDEYMDRLQANRLEAPGALRLGGMGLISALARLKLVDRTGFSYSIGNRPGGGAIVTFRGNASGLQEEKE